MIFPGGIVRALAHHAAGYYASLARNGTTEPFRNQMLDFDGLNRMIGTPEMIALGKHYETHNEARSIPSRSRCSTAASSRSPTRWTRRCSARRSIRSSRRRTTPATASIMRETGATLVQGTSGLPIFVGAMAFAVKAVIDKVARDGGLEPGDTYLFNDPYDGGTHLNDVRLVRPLMRDGKGLRLARLGRPLARRRRQCAGQLQRQGDRKLPGRLPHPAGEADARRA